ncbi:anion permease [Rhodococcus spelaei]|uniref:anion permease n=1 Tax=Rhodococcus spelaei TaxID=2546320 RepID=UPI0015EFB6FA|nr:anion permease [Rhodococcus spelaei]
MLVGTRLLPNCTPATTTANMTILGPGSYRFGDYWRMGRAMTAWFLVVAVVVIPIFWRF